MNQELQKLWRAQPAEPLQVLPTDELARSAVAFRQRIARRNRTEWVASAFVIPVFLLYAWIFPSWLTKLGALMTVAGVGVLLWQLQRRAASRALPNTLGQDLLAFHRAELVRQRDTLRSVWIWYLGPLMPGLAVFLWGRMGELAGTGAAAWHPWILAFIGAFLAAVLLVNLRGSRRLQRQIDELDALNEPTQTKGDEP